jgi:replication factor C large subunit
VLPFLEAVTHHWKPRELTVAMAAAYDLDEAGVAFVTGSGESTNKVASIVEDAQARREELIEEHADGAFALDGARRGDEGDAAADRDGDGSGSTDSESDPADSGEEPADDESPNESDDDDQAGLTDFM